MQLRMLTLALGGCLLAAICAASRATPIDPREVNLAAGSMLVDAEVAMMSKFVGDDPSILSYGAVIGPTGWSGRLTGYYAGHAIDIRYLGTDSLAANDTYDITFSSFGSLTCLFPSASCTDLSWYDSGVWTYQDEQDPPSETTAKLVPKLGPDGNPTGFQIAVGVGNGVWSLTADLVKDFAQHVFTATVTGAVLDGLASAGGNFTYNQAEAATNPGRDSSQLFAQALFGLFKWRKTVDTSTLFTPPNPVVVETPPPPPAGTESLGINGPFPASSNPLLDIPGFAPPDPTGGALPAGEEFMYVQNEYVTEPATLALLGLGLLGLGFARLRKK